MLRDSRPEWIIDLFRALTRPIRWLQYSRNSFHMSDEHYLFEEDERRRLEEEEVEDTDEDEDEDEDGEDSEDDTKDTEDEDEEEQY